MLFKALIDGRLAKNIYNFAIKDQELKFNSKAGVCKVSEILYTLQKTAKLTYILDQTFPNLHNI